MDQVLCLPKQSTVRIGLNRSLSDAKELNLRLFMEAKAKINEKSLAAIYRMGKCCNVVCDRILPARGI